MVLTNFKAVILLGARNDVQDAWNDYITKQYDYMGQFAKAWLDEALGILDFKWAAEYNRALNAGLTNQQLVAIMALEVVSDF